MKLGIEIMRHGFGLEVPEYMRGRQSLVVRTDMENHFHIDLLSDRDGKFDLSHLRDLVDRLRLAEGMIR